MMQNESKQIMKHAAVSAAATALYVALIAMFLFYVPKALGEKEDTVLVPIVMLLIFVFSAAVTGFLLLGKPVLWYLEGKKREAITLFAQTLVFFFGITAAALLALLLFA